MSNPFSALDESDAVKRYMKKHGIAKKKVNNPGCCFNPGAKNCCVPSNTNTELDDKHSGEWIHNGGSYHSGRKKKKKKRSKK